jgi:hypothetical protein
MTAPLAEAFPSAEPAATSRRIPRLPEWLREPLLHFLLLGGALFALDRALRGGDEGENVIVVSAEVDREAREQFLAARGRQPNAKELEALRQIWLDNEVLYRQGLELGLDRGDDAIRERVIFKALSVVNGNVKPLLPDDGALRAWFEKNREKYDEPARFDFDEAALSGDSSEAAVRAFVGELNSGTPGDAKAGLRVFKGRPRSNLVDSYGADFASMLEASQPGVWHAYKTRDGWRAIKLNAVTAAQPARFETVRGPVLHDWTDAMAAEQRTAAVRALARKYKIEYESSK